MVEQSAFDGWNHEGGEEEVASSVKALCHIEGDHDGISCVECVRHIDGEAKQTCEVEQHGDSTKDVVHLEPVNDHCQIGPYLPTYEECDAVLQQSLPGWIFHSLVTYNTDDTNVQQVDEQLETTDLAGPRRTP